MKQIIKPIAVLTIICMVVTAALAYVNHITKPIIQHAEEKAASEARSEVLKEASAFEKITDIKLPEGVAEMYRGSDNSGYVVITQSKGYGGNIRIICGILPDGKIEAVKTLIHAETNGIGSKVADNGSGYNKQYSGKTIETFGEVQAVSGATISSKAYKKAVELALEAYRLVKEAGL